ncbi:MAG TPA: hypothetical protein DIT65_04555 [Cryomorphaceae bacterium]|nr:hypothetical protein [Cryomorphaceae bacterium]
MNYRILIAFSFPLSLVAQSGGSSLFSFLDRSIFAGSSALANTAYLNPAAEGAYALQNPLLLNDSTLYNLEISYGSLGEGIQLAQSSFGYKAFGHAFMLGVQNISYGEFNATDTWGNSLGIFTAGDLSMSVGTSLFGYQEWEFGTNFKLVSGTYESYQSWAIASDFVAMRRYQNSPDIVIIAKNIGMQLTTFADQREPMPLNLLVAIGDKLKYAPFRWTFVIDQIQRPNLGYDDPNNIMIDPITGEENLNPQSYLNLVLRHLSGSIEFIPTHRMHLMMGYSFRRQYEMALPTRRTSGGFTLGAGVYLDKFNLIYANELRSVAGRMNTLSLGIQL